MTSKVGMLIVGNPNEGHVGAHLLDAARDLSISAKIMNVESADKASWLVSKVSHKLFRKPPRFKRFSLEVVRECSRFKPSILLATGICPINQQALVKISSMSIKTINYLTDDPWNTAHKADWFIKALPEYSKIYSPRRANITDLKKVGCLDVSYLLFAYAPRVHYREVAALDNSQKGVDVIFVGGADHDRVPYVQALISAGISIELYGGYWEKYLGKYPGIKGIASLDAIRKASARCKIALCLVRRANRDGHVMRTFEAAAMGNSMLVENTEEHREIFGSDGKNVVFFSQVSDMVTQAKRLIDDVSERKRLGEAVYDLMAHEKHAYKDRLRTVLSNLSEGRR